MHAPPTDINEKLHEGIMLFINIFTSFSCIKVSFCLYINSLVLVFSFVEKMNCSNTAEMNAKFKEERDKIMEELANIAAEKAMHAE